MKLDRLHEISKEKGYQFRYDPKTGITIFGRKNENISFRIKQIPRNIVFRNKGDVKLELIKKLPNTISFENGGNVFLGEITEIPENYNQFNNTGNLIPENIVLKRPKVKYFFSEEFLFFLNDNIKNKWIKKLSEINNTYIEKDDAFQSSFIDCHDDVTFLPLKSIFSKYGEYKEEKKKQEEKEKAAELERAAKAVKKTATKAGAVDRVARELRIDPNDQKSKKKKNREGIDNYLANNKGILLKEGLKNKIKIGRFMKRLFPEMTDPEIEEVVNLYKGFQNSKDCGLEIVRGEQIVHFYCRKNQTVGSSGRLANSCMNYNDEKDERFRNLQFYSSIPNCGLLILRDPANKEKIIGRALHWKASDGRTYVDQIYTAKEADTYIYRRYIKMNGCLSAMNGDVSKLEIECSDKTAKLDHYMPYLDTMNYDRKSNKVMSRR
jgi:hypothetical protein